VVALAFAGCGAANRTCPVDRGALPSWATAGFSDAHPSAPHVVGDDDRITAILFGDPLTSLADATRANKTLSVARVPVRDPAPLKNHAVDGSRSVERVVPSGVGPSIVDLPAGCWTLSLSWGAGGHDTVDLRYARGHP